MCVMRFGKPAQHDATFSGWLTVSCLLLTLAQTSVAASESPHRRSVPSDNGDTLLPNLSHHTSMQYRPLRDTQQCQRIRYGNVTHSLHPAHRNQSALAHVVDVHHKVTLLGTPFYDQRMATLRFQRVHNPLLTLSVMEPKHPGSCAQDTDERSTVHDTAATRGCIVAANAGFFNTHTGACLGNVVSDGKLVQDSGGIQNVHFGITKDGQLFTGYLAEIELVTQNFQQLVGGVVWLIRDGEIYVDESKKTECPDTQETGSLDRFISVVSARTAVGHDSEGRVLMVQMNGKTDVDGANLHEFASLLKDLGFVNAINLDGGGSVTNIINGTLTNFPSDTCDDKLWNCARKVTTILCVHEVECSPPDCSGHGQCVAGQCQCQPYWSGPSCDTLHCPPNCSRHGHCLEDGCHCQAGWRGENCSTVCAQGTYGVNCSGCCQCQNGATCDPVSGQCVCPPGYTGTSCESECPYSFYGQDCAIQCQCSDSCFCDHVTGDCNTTLPTHYLQAGECLIQARIKRDKLVPDRSVEILRWTWATISLGVVASLSITLNVWLLTVVLKSRNKTSKRTDRRRRAPPKPLNNIPPASGDSFTLYTGHRMDSMGSTDEANEETAFMNKSRASPTHP